ncbi:Isocitrate dehydrogenase [NADP] 2 [Symbiodinium microadriaticum]|uniref:Isocitrate dehydrogenase [NADP] 2 n=1 Tax=Symbiodinium microadriaticum TaxID=2951 RepID=A0A1Q9DM69_SYMMI|nr:Isocitrate dehydrogenase [NADP] 2 [Symbiodinium microadriaticum]
MALTFRCRAPVCGHAFRQFAAARFPLPRRFAVAAKGSVASVPSFDPENGEVGRKVGAVGKSRSIAHCGLVSGTANATHVSERTPPPRRWLRGARGYSGEELAILAQAFQRYDGEPCPLTTDTYEVSELFASLDLNKDGTVELTEWLDNMPAGTKLRVLQKDLQLPGFLKAETDTSSSSWRGWHDKSLLLPVMRAYCRFSGVKIMKKAGVLNESFLADISLSARILATFPDYLRPAQRVEELQAKGFAVPDFPAEPSTEQEVEIRARYAKVLSREPSTRRSLAVPSTRCFVKAVPPGGCVTGAGGALKHAKQRLQFGSLRERADRYDWAPDSKSNVATMSDGDFFSSEQSYISEVGKSGETQVLKAKTPLLSGEIIDSSVMRAPLLQIVAELRKFYEQEMQSTVHGAAQVGPKALAPQTMLTLPLMLMLLQLLMPVLMMMLEVVLIAKVSDPVLFGHCVEVFYKDAFEKHAALFQELGVNPNNGVGDVYTKIAGHPKQVFRESSYYGLYLDYAKAEVEADLMACYDKRPPLAYVDSRRGITNLHVPSDVIVDASMAAAVRDAGRMWTKEDTLCDAKFVIPDRCYSGIYTAVIEDCKKNGKLDPSKIGATSNVGLMAAKAEEYGSHDKTFVVPEDGQMRVIKRDTEEVKQFAAYGISGPAVFWLTEQRAHDRSVISKVKKYLERHDTEGLDIQILSPEEVFGSRQLLYRDDYAASNQFVVDSSGPNLSSEVHECWLSVANDCSYEFAVRERSQATRGV